MIKKYDKKEEYSNLIIKKKHSIDKNTYCQIL